MVRSWTLIDGAVLVGLNLVRTSGFSGMQPMELYSVYRMLFERSVVWEGKKDERGDTGSRESTTSKTS